MGDGLLGRPIWHELVTTDMGGAEAFYDAVIGWSSAPFEGASASAYTRFSRDGGVAVAGLMAVPDGMSWPPHWVMYVGTPALDHTVAHAEGLGGKILSPLIEVPNVGKGRVMLDPQGAMFALWQPSMEMQGQDVEPVIGDPSWHELYTADVTAAKTFYATLFGWRELGAHDMGPIGTYYLFGRSFPLGGMMNKTKEMESLPSCWNIYFQVADVAAAAQRVTANGGQVLMGPTEVPGGDTIVQALDPQGAAFALHQRKTA